MIKITSRTVHTPKEWGDVEGESGMAEGGWILPCLYLFSLQYTDGLSVLRCCMTHVNLADGEFAIRLLTISFAIQALHTSTL